MSPPTSPQEYILKGVVNASIGQLTESREHIKMAQQYFQLVGASASECDTIPNWGVAGAGGIPPRGSRVQIKGVHRV